MVDIVSIISLIIILVSFVFILFNYKLGIYLTLVSMPIWMHKIWVFDNYISLYKVFAIFVIISYIIYMLKNIRDINIDYSQLFLPIIILWGFSFFSLTYSSDFRAGLNGLLLLAFNYILFLMILNGISNLNDVNFLIKVIGLQGIILIAVLIVGYFVPSFTRIKFLNSFFNLINSSLQQKYLLKIYLLIISLGLLYLVFCYKNIYLKCLFSLSYAFSIFILFIYRSFADVSVYIVSLFVFLLLLRKRIINYIIVGLIGASLLAWVVFTFMPDKELAPVKIANKVNIAVKSEIKNEVKYAKSVFSVLTIKDIILGFGAGSYKKSVYNYKIYDGIDHSLLNNAMVFKIFAELGIIGLLVFISILVLVVKSFFLIIQSIEVYPELNLFIALFMGLLVYSFFSSVFLELSYTWIFLALFFIAEKIRKKQRESDTVSELWET